MATKFESQLLTSNFNMPMTSVKLDGKNYISWSKSATIFLKGKELSSHLVNPKPDSNNSTFAQWKQEDAQILSLMLTSKESNICSSLIHFYIVQEVWSHLKHMYSSARNTTCIYELCKQFFGLEQGTLGLEEYYAHHAMLSRHGSQLSFDPISERSTLVASYVVPGGRGGRGVRSACGGRDAKGNRT
ncbi:hypothetical protein CIPAW_01G100200 [Carya illinoinensis]|uniref:Retrotransposon Copia-like N-terminal domain-containing protein n=1 Tax=Carya illinoinensis TaxID=32201 RepID=A0A8T1RM83_CARIL|nr:hypothetical protein CIPAW_01G100200 [Carya illinoinensis]